MNGQRTVKAVMSELPSGVREPNEKRLGENLGPSAVFQHRNGQDLLQDEASGREDFCVIAGRIQERDQRWDETRERSGTK